MSINAERLWNREQELGHIGADPHGGISRFAWTPEYRQAVELLSKWMKEAGMTVRMDTVGNLFGRYEGKNKNLAPVLTGSHLDTVPSGGCFDGLAGIMSALEAVSTMFDRGEIPERSIEIVAFINEEASQFLGGCFGSKAMVGQLPDDYTHTCLHRYTKQSLHDAMLEFDMGLEPDNIQGSVLKKDDYYLFLELHIEQGRYLLEKNLPMAVVTSIAGIKQFYITINGVSCHAGGMAMEDRHDAMAAAAAVACEVERLACNSGSFTRGTVGNIVSDPGEHNIVAQKCVVSVDFREHQDDIWEKLYTDLIAFTETECQKRGLTYSVHSTINAQPVHCDPAINSLISRCATDAGVPHMEMISFPAHDAQQLAHLFPIGMIFLRSLNDGRSHCPDEYTCKEDLSAGTEVLYRTLWKAANESIL
mgnify:CR=1 FL=1